MRTTIRLSEQAFAVAASVARQRRISLGDAVSELILRPTAPSGTAPMARSGIPVFDCERPVTLDDVRSLDE
jgi:hypothetical protein